MAPNTQITLSLSPELANIIHSKARSYKYESDAEYVEDMLADLHEIYPGLHINSRQELEIAIMEGLNDIDAGRTMPIEEAFQQLRENLGLLPKL